MSELEMCCGGTTVRALCEYHRPEPETQRSHGPIDCDNFTGKAATPCKQYMRTYRDGVVVDEEPIEAYRFHVPAMVRHSSVDDHTADALAYADTVRVYAAGPFTLAGNAEDALNYSCDTQSGAYEWGSSKRNWRNWVPKQ